MTEAPFHILSDILEAVSCIDYKDTALMLPQHLQRGGNRPAVIVEVGFLLPDMEYGIILFDVFAPCKFAFKHLLSPLYTELRLILYISKPPELIIPQTAVRVKKRS